MLVHFKYPRGFTFLEGKHVYGYLEKHDPTRISYGTWRAHRKDLIAASYNKRLLEKMFPDSEFPDINFTYYELPFLNWEQMCQLCKAFGITTSLQNRLRRRSLKRYLRIYC